MHAFANNEKIRRISNVFIWVLINVCLLMYCEIKTLSRERKQ